MGDQLNLYQKINKIKAELQTTVIKKSGKNKFVGYDYFELPDFLPIIVSLCDKYGVHTLPSFNNDFATLIITDCDDPKQSTQCVIPLGSAALKGCHEVQNIGATITYQRRYLYMSAFDLTEHDPIDSSDHKTDIKSQQVKLIEEILEIASSERELLGKGGSWYTRANLEKHIQNKPAVKTLKEAKDRLIKNIEEMKDKRSEMPVQEKELF